MGQVRIHRHRQSDQFTTLPNALLQDGAMSWGARGLLAFLLSLPQDWQIRTADLIDRSPGGEARLRTLRGELEGVGYLRKRRVCDARGRVTEWVWEVTDEAGRWPDGDSPHVENPHVGNPHVDSPHVENHRAYKETSDKRQIDKRHTPPNPPEGGEREGAPAAVGSEPEQPPVVPDPVAARYRAYPWLDSRRRPLPGLLEYVIRSLPKKEDRAEAVAMARAYILKAGALEGREEAMWALWEDYQAEQQRRDMTPAERERMEQERQWREAQARMEQQA